MPPGLVNSKTNTINYLNNYSLVTAIVTWAFCQEI